MPFISKEDFTSHIYAEDINSISGDDDSKLDEAIEAAMLKAKRQLSKYDVDSIFAITEAEDKKPYKELIRYIKDIAKWNFIGVCNLNVDYEDAEKRYKAAIAELKDIKNGELIDGWLTVSENTEKPFRSGSGSKFNHYY